MQTPDHDWLGYINISRNWRPRKLLVEALPYVKERGAALDLGSGALYDSRFLLTEGFGKVIAVDNAIGDTQARELLAVPEELLSHFQFIHTKIEDFILPKNEFDLVNIQFVLPFIAKDKIDQLLGGIKDSLKSGGIFVGQFFGQRDSWSGFSNVSVLNESEVKNYLAELEIIYFVEEESDGQTATKAPKHWHLFNFIARKK